ncbi:hypothetical protein [Cryobacterium zhongshanensis]|uniref:Uncharacterized protein n=1 Tax=Cryobacterium zhongshanensis TaxID=2928153 RepID=A0AA41UHJ1_9MICO|nr:hypothetical protein [Cryobacterium zhongshanensis]MCI4658494.1 hypothetical protein [Cryobacterium zhongshanensis]
MRFAHQRRFVVASVGSGIALILVVIVGVYGLLRGPAQASRSEPPPPAASVSPTPTSTALAGQPQTVLVTSTPELFARSIARSLFTWDTRDPGGLSSWAQKLVDVADADEASAVAADVRGYLPGAESWKQLSAFGTRQWLELESVAVPAAWSTAQGQATAGQIPRGAAAFTVVGTRHRVGTWDTEVVRTKRRVTFTIFIACPDQKPCSLLRISQLDRPLE